MKDKIFLTLRNYFEFISNFYEFILFKISEKGYFCAMMW